MGGYASAAGRIAPNTDTNATDDKEENVSAVSWNAWYEELVCLSGGGLLSVKAANFPPAAQPLTGSVVGFQGGRVFCLQSNAMQTVGVPLSHAAHQYLQHGKFTEAYAVACLSATRADWERLAVAALNHLEFDVARNAYQRIEDVSKLVLLDDLQERLASGEARGLLTAEVSAHCGRFAEAARAFVAAGRPQRALHMYIDLRMFNKAQEYVDENETGVLARRRAEWARHVSEPRAAAEMLLAAGDVRGATALLADAGRRDMLLELARDMDKGSTEGLRHVAAALVRVGEGAAAADLYHRLTDYNSEAALLVARGEWTRAFALARDHPECSRSVHLAYAQRMARDNNFFEAQKGSETS
ncbi:Intraflagellar transport protein 122 homolog [Eumeta japonica]|uniref:Intraflagellar transport protein 122 homolog n=1 Tax=Eumeta variegata TaxID=151549 RepID=A0A4C1V281_EUMVA|nr:Intraflagellar transport protein 122 homolog [Eumeta japonica]